MLREHNSEILAAKTVDNCATDRNISTHLFSFGVSGSCMLIHVNGRS
jgi:hypothetical protein